MVRGDPASALLMKPRSIRRVEAHVESVAKQRDHQFRSVDFADLARKHYLLGWRRQSRRCRRSMHHKSRIIVSTARFMGAWAGLGLRAPGAPAGIPRTSWIRGRLRIGGRFADDFLHPRRTKASGPAAVVARIPGRSICLHARTRTDGASRRGIGDSRKNLSLTRFGWKLSQVILEVSKSHGQDVVQVYCRLETSQQQVYSKLL